MKFLKDLGFDEKTIDVLVSELPSKTTEIINKEQDKVINNIKFLKDLGVSNYQDAFLKFYNMFLLDTEAFNEIFSKYDREDLIVKLEKNIAIMEYL